MEGPSRKTTPSPISSRDLKRISSGKVFNCCGKFKRAAFVGVQSKPRSYSLIRNRFHPRGIQPPVHAPLYYTDSLFEIRGFIPGFPLDITADPGFLVRGNLPAAQKRLQRRAKVLSRDGQVVSRPAVVHLAPVHQSAVFVEEIKLRGAGRAVSLGRFLGRVVAQGGGDRKSTRL